jgi:hypothetical protein
VHVPLVLQEIIPLLVALVAHLATLDPGPSLPLLHALLAMLDFGRLRARLLLPHLAWLVDLVPGLWLAPLLVPAVLPENGLRQ